MTPEPEHEHEGRGRACRVWQIILSKELDGMHVTLPAYSRNFYVDGHVPEPH